MFLISLKAGNTGLNLTGACVVVHADPWWNAAAQDQATDRAHRIGQTQDVNVYQIVAKDTIEERILNLQRSKTDLGATVLVDLRVLRHRTVDGRAHQGRPARPVWGGTFFPTQQSIRRDTIGAWMFVKERT